MNKVLSVIPLILALTGCIHSGFQSQTAPGSEEVVTLFDQEARDVVVHSTFGAFGVNSWRVVDDRTMIIDTLQHGDLVATFMAPCRGIRYTETLGFVTLGPFDLDKTTQVLLPDGTRCHFKSIKPLIKLEDPQAVKPE